MEVKIGDKIRDKKQFTYLTVEWIGNNNYAGVNHHNDKVVRYIEKNDLEFYVEPARSFKETKVRVYNDELSRKVQEALFKLGYEWGFGGKQVFSGMAFIIINEDMYSHKDDSFYIEHNYKEVQAHEILEEAGKL